MTNTVQLRAGDARHRDLSLVALTSVCLAVATLVTTAWIAVGVLLIGN
jgi:hypothetical protein